MGSKNKLKRFNENDTFHNVFQPKREDLVDAVYPLKGQWNQQFFKNNNPLVLELGCGKGEYTVGLAERYPNKNFIGIDIKGARFWRGAKTAIENELPNVAFIRAQIELIEELFAANEVDEIWITFPDPQIKYKRTKHRMTNDAFLKRYKNILNADGIMHLKTDSEFMHGYTLGTFAWTRARGPICQPRCVPPRRQPRRGDRHSNLLRKPVFSHSKSNYVY